MLDQLTREDTPRTVAVDRLVGDDCLAWTLGRNARMQRSLRNVTLSIAANATSLSDLDYVASEEGYRRFTPSEIIDLCALLGITPGQLFEE